jgi:hypothetical protein
VAIWNFILLVVNIIGFLLAWIWLIFKYLLYVIVIVGGIGGFAAIAGTGESENLFWVFVIIALVTFVCFIILNYIVFTYLGGLDVPVFLQLISL